MAITAGTAATGEAHSTTNTVTTKTISLTISGAANRVVLVGVGWERAAGTTTVSGVTLNGVAMTKLAEYAITNGTQYNGACQFVILESSLPAAGAYNVVATLTNASLSCMVAAQEFSGVDVEAAIATAYGGVTSGTDCNTPVFTTTRAGSFLCDCVCGGYESTWSPYAGQVDDFDFATVTEPGTTLGGSHQNCLTPGDYYNGETFGTTINRAVEVSCVLLPVIEATGNWFLLQMKNEPYNSINTQLR